MRMEDAWDERWDSPCLQVHILLLDARAKSDVLPHRHVLEQGKALKHESHPPLLHRDVRYILVCTH